MTKLTASSSCIYTVYSKHIVVQFDTVVQCIKWPSFNLILVIALIGNPTEYTELQQSLTWRTFHHEGKISPAGEGGGCTPTPFHYSYHHQ
jgi:hypothetical protein